MSERNRAEGTSHQQAQDLATLYQASQLYLSQSNVDAILETSCRLAVEHFGAKMAWVGLITEGDVEVHPAKVYGAEEGYLEAIHITRNKSPTGRGPTGTAIRTGELAVTNQIETDPAYEPWRAEALKRGFRSSAAFPLCVGERVLGTLNVYSAEPGSFSEERVQVLQSFANLTAIALERARLQEQTRLYAEEMERQVAERTAKLLNINRQLQRALAEQMRTEEALRRSLEETAHSRRLLLALSQVSQAILRARTPGEAYRVMSDKAARLGYHAVVLMTTEDGKHLVIPKESLKPPLIEQLEKLTGFSIQDYRLPLTPGGSYQRMIEKAEAVFRDQEASASLVAEALPGPLRSLTHQLTNLLGIKQSICAPLMLNDRAVGLLAISGSNLTEADVPAVVAFANQVALALENARLHQEARAWAAELEQCVTERTRELSETGARLEHEIAERQAMEEMWRRYEAIINTSAELMTLINTDYVYEAVNDAFCRALGRTREGILSRNVADIWGEEPFRQGIQHALDECFAGETVRHQCWLEFPALGTRYFEITHYPLYSSTGIVTHAIVIFHDMTERKNVEDTLYQHAERLRILREIHRAMLTARSMEEIAGIVTRRLHRLVPCLISGVTLFDFEAHTLSILAINAQGKPVTVGRSSFPLNVLPASEIRTLRRGEIYITEDLTLLRLLLSEVQTPQVRRVHACGGFPLIAQGELIGVLCLGLKDIHALSPGEMKIVQEITDSLASALRDALLTRAITNQQKALRRLSIQLMEAQEAERKRISQELHDEVGQALTAINLGLGLVAKELPKGTPASVRQTLKELEETVEEALKQVRDLSLDLRPSTLDDLGLIPTLRWYLSRYAQRINAEIFLEATEFETRPSAEIETAIYRAVQEGLTNIARHANPAHVWVRLEQDPSVIRVIIEDDGHGFDVQQAMDSHKPPSGLGLLGIRERVASLGGRFSIQSHPGQGTRLYIELPWRVEHAQDSSATG